MEKEYEVTIAMPVYNVESRVKDSLLSALNQTFDSIEFLIIDDKGSDRSIEVVKELIATHPRGKHVRIIDHGINRGTGATKNSAIDNASGDYLYFMDSDDIITPNCIEKLYETAKKDNAELVMASHIMLDNHFNIIQTVGYGNYSSNISLTEYIYKYGGAWNIPTWNKLYKLEFLRSKNIRCIPHHLCEDMYFSFMVTLFCQHFTLINDCTYQYIMYDNSSTAGGNGWSKKFCIMYFEALDEMTRLYSSYTMKHDNIAKQIFYYYCRLLFRVKTSPFICEEEKKVLMTDVFNTMMHRLDDKDYKSCSSYLSFVEHMLMGTEPIDWRKIKFSYEFCYGVYCNKIKIKFNSLLKKWFTIK